MRRSSLEPAMLCRAKPLARAAAVLLLLAGCNPGSGSRPVSYSIWQSQIQQYVADHGNGDLSALHAVQIAPGQPGFRSFSHDRPEQSKDIVGVLVGLQPQDQRLWYVYLVGEIDREQLTRLSLAAVSHESGTWTWRVGSDDTGGTAAYVARRQEVWHQQHGEYDPPRSALGFPSDTDQFTMSAAGDTITVRESTSGATWTLDLSDQAAR